MHVACTGKSALALQTGLEMQDNEQHRDFYDYEERAR